MADTKEKNVFARLIDFLKGFFKGVLGEYKKVVWPPRKQLIDQTVEVLIICAVIGLIISGMDYLFMAGYQWLMKLV